MNLTYSLRKLCKFLSVIDLGAKYLAFTALQFSSLVSFS